ncbi:hypothetical protein D9M71_339940 [compost metagenome]
MGAVGQRRGLVEEGAGEGDDLLAAPRVVASAFLGTILLADRIGAVEGVVQRAPAGVGGVQRVTRVHHRHYQLRAGLLADLAVDVAGGDLYLIRLRHQVADGFEEAAISRGIVDRTGMAAVPVVQFDLQAVAFDQQGTVLRRQFVHQQVEAFPEIRYRHAGARQGFFLDETQQAVGNLQSMSGRSVDHRKVLQ